MPEQPTIIYAYNPATGARLEPGFAEASTIEIDNAVAQANEAFESGPGLATEKAAFLRLIAEEILALGDDLIRTAESETGLPEKRLMGERQRTVDQLRMFAKVVEEGCWLDARIDTADPDRRPVPKPDIRSMLTAIGPIVVFGASNFPFAFSTAGGDTASALAAGCPVIFKAHPAHPATSQLVAGAITKAAARAGVHPGMFSHLQGTQPVGAALVSHPHVKGVAFTGSQKGGLALAKLANERPEPIPVFAEMGSINPIFLLPGALEARGEAIAKDFAAALTLGVGQFCTNPGLVIGVRGDALASWKKAVETELSSVGPQPMLTAGIAEAYKNACDGFSRQGESLIEGAQDGFMVKPSFFAVSADAFLSEGQWQEEAFGPVGLLVECKSEAELLQVARTLQGQLTATVHAESGDHELEISLVPILARRVGRVIRNGYPTGVEVCDSMHHGGPFPATTDVRFTSVGTRAILRFARPICYQNASPDLLPLELRDENCLGIDRRVNSKITSSPISQVAIEPAK